MFQRFVYFIMLLGCLWLALFLWFLNTIPPVKTTDRVAEADAIIVLTGGLERIPFGLKLLNAGKGKKLFISGVFDKTDKDAIFLKKPLPVQQAYALHKEQIELGYHAKNTRENAVEVAQWLKENPHYHKLIIVTDHYHMPRSLKELRQRVANDVILIPAAVASPPFNEGDKRYSLSNLLQLAQEFHKYLVVTLQYAVWDIQK